LSESWAADGDELVLRLRLPLRGMPMLRDVGTDETKA